MQKRYKRYPWLMFRLRRLQGINYEKEMELLDVLCDRDKTSVDIGAKLGMYTHRLLRHSRDVVAVEPIPLLVNMLERVFRKHKCHVVPCALSDQPGHTVMRIPYGSNGEVKFGRSTIEANNSLTHDDVAHVEEIEVELKTLDECGVEGVGFIKIDVEGHELAVLKGAVATLERERPNLLVEANDHHHPDAVSKLHGLLSGLGYRGLFLGPEGLAESKSVADATYFQRESIENFMFVHESRNDITDRIADRVG
jgi:FkbM family methyltransferase